MTDLDLQEGDGVGCDGGMEGVLIQYIFSHPCGFRPGSHGPSPRFTKVTVRSAKRFTNVTVRSAVNSFNYAAFETIVYVLKFELEDNIIQPRLD